MALALELALAIRTVNALIGLFTAVASSKREARKLADDWRQLQGVLEGASHIGSLGPTHVAVLKSVEELADRTSTILHKFAKRGFFRKLIMISSAKDRDTIAALSDDLDKLMRALGIAIAVDAASHQMDTASLLQQISLRIIPIIGRTEGDKPAAQIGQTAGPPPPYTPAVGHNKAQTLLGQTASRQAAAVVKANELARLKEEQRLIVLDHEIELQELRAEVGQVRSAYIDPGTSTCTITRRNVCTELLTGPDPRT
mmetsp:Transcript_11998/g.31359  ORF Transcript_11998/g.31359 Transcript_11998/m.31359 type:complete len:256 (+) Transcript_11998:98-865(+)|eukprot:CAMPEP_0179911616 /NCGR_PEP_ID=MMETSP0982-20121206/46460_1 /TAXON_ID=483367 /ORGANISM="non described non described, Strain CCMP 2436" /LENGTH=255 /DNA_ID=CAMNT_0021813377 /DNA_START=64 /DNA_END=831 /DNA_ORIENTATION=+